MGIGPSGAVWSPGVGKPGLTRWGVWLASRGLLDEDHLERIGELADGDG